MSQQIIARHQLRDVVEEPHQIALAIAMEGRHRESPAPDFTARTTPGQLSQRAAIVACGAIDRSQRAAAKWAIGPSNATTRWRSISSRRSSRP